MVPGGAFWRVQCPFEAHRSSVAESFFCLYACPSSSLGGLSLAYVERNLARAGILGSAVEYPWSSTGAHMTGKDEYGNHLQRRCEP